MNVRRSLGISRRDQIRNGVQRRMGIEESLMTDVERRQLVWYRHVKRMDNTRLTKWIMEWIPPHRRKRGRPRKSWMEGVSKAMSSRNLTENQWWVE